MPFLTLEGGGGRDSVDRLIHCQPSQFSWTALFMHYFTKQNHFFLILKSETGKISVLIEIKIVFLESVFQRFDTHAYCIPLQLYSYFVHMNCGGDNSLVRRASSLLVCSSGSWRKIKQYAEGRRPRVPSFPPSMGHLFMSLVCHRT